MNVPLSSSKHTYHTIDLEKVVEFVVAISRGVWWLNVDKIGHSILIKAFQDAQADTCSDD